MNTFTKYWLLIFLLAAPVAFTGCSSSPSAEDGEVMESELAMSDEELPAADEVGSIPEDGAFGGEDPFADLEDNLESTDVAGAEMVSMEPAMGMDTAAAPSGGQATYTVQAGDTLMKIAFSLYGDVHRWKELRDLNAATVGNGQSLVAGTVINYQDEGGFQRQVLDYSYLIKRGDTLGGIAKQVYGQVMKYKRLQEYNPRLIRDPNKIYAGFTIYYNLTAEDKNQMASASNSQPLEVSDEPVAVAPAAVAVQ